MPRGATEAYSHQDYNPIVIGKKANKKKDSNTVVVHKKKDEMEIKIPPKWNRAFALAVQKARGAHEPPLKQKDLANRLGVQQNMISDMEACKGKYNAGLANRVKNFFRMESEPSARAPSLKKVST